MPITRPLVLPLARPLDVDDLGGAAPTPVPVYATWNPDDKAASVTLSLGDLRAERPSGFGWANVRATIGKSTGKWRWRKVNGTGAHLIVGVGTDSAPLADFLGADANGWGFYVGNNGFYTVHGGSVVLRAGLGQDVEVEVRLDLDGNTLSLYEGATERYTFDISSRGASTLYPMQSMFAAGAAATANFGPDDLGTPVAGYNDGVYE